MNTVPSNKAENMYWPSNILGEGKIKRLPLKIKRLLPLKTPYEERRERRVQTEGQYQYVSYEN